MQPGGAFSRACGRIHGTVRLLREPPAGTTRRYWRRPRRLVVSIRPEEEVPTCWLQNRMSSHATRFSR